MGVILGQPFDSVIMVEMQVCFLCIHMYVYMYVCRCLRSRVYCNNGWNIRTDVVLDQPFDSAIMIEMQVCFLCTYICVCMYVDV